ncbi:hypothetical protein [Aeromicrobium sp. P5_D10]
MLFIIIFAVLAVLGAAAWWKLSGRGRKTPRFDELSREDQVSYMRNQQGIDGRRGTRDSVKGLGAGRGSINGGGWGP